MAKSEITDEPYHGILWRIGTHIPIISSVLAVCDSKHTCVPSPIDPTKSMLCKRYFRSTTTKLLVHYRVWTPPAAYATQPRAVIYIVHGIAEYVGRYEHVANALAAQGFLVCGLDHQGCGESEGDRGYFEHFQDLVNDVIQLATDVVVPSPSTTVPRYLLGHSMGGLVSLHTVHTAPSLFQGFILSGPALLLDPKVDTTMNRFLVGALTGLLPKLGVQQLDSKTIAFDKAVVAQYERDPLVYHGKVSMRVGSEMMYAMDSVPTWIGKIMLPLLVVHGGNDVLCNPKGSEMLMEKAVSIKDKTLNIYPGLYHEIFNEAKGPEIVEDIVQWITKRL